MKKTGGSDAISEVEHNHNNRVASLDHAHVNKSIVHVATQ